jgi:hypothetical protein
MKRNITIKNEKTIEKQINTEIKDEKSFFDTTLSGKKNILNIIFIDQKCLENKKY